MRPVYYFEGDDKIAQRLDGDVVRDNTIMNVFDAGIEGVNAVTNTVIANNTVTNAILAGIGSYHCTHWASNTVNGNRVSSGQFLIDIFSAWMPSALNHRQVAPQHVRLSPITGFINGGGNVCDAGLNIPSFRDFYLNCGKSAGSASVGADRAARHADLGSGSILRSAPGFSSVSRYSNRDPLH
jgi:hypothetical protein